MASFFLFLFLAFVYARVIKNYRKCCLNICRLTSLKTTPIMLIKSCSAFCIQWSMCREWMLWKKNLKTLWWRSCQAIQCLRSSTSNLCGSIIYQQSHFLCAPRNLTKKPRIGFLWFMVVIYFAPSFVRAFALLIWACSQRDCLYCVPVDYLVTCVIGALPTE